MGTPFTPVSGSASISATTFSLTNNSTTLTPQTTQVKLVVMIDALAMLTGDQYRVQVLDKINGGPQIVIWEGFITGATPEAYKIPPTWVSEGWDVQVKLITGSARTLGWTLKEDVGDRNAATISAGAVNAAAIATDAIDADAFKADAVTEIQSGLATSSALAAVQADTDDIQARLPSALVGGRIASDVGSWAGTAVAVPTVAGIPKVEDATLQARLTPTRAALLDNLDAAVSVAVSAIANVQSRIPAALDGAGNIKAGVQTIAAGAVTAASAASDFLTAVGGAVWGVVSEGTETVLHQLRLLRARELGKATVRDGDGTYTFRDALDTKDRIVGARSGTARTTSMVDGT